jgi:cytochrome c biogenesis protein
MGQRLEDAREVKAKRHVKNVGPSIQFKVRDAEGQAREYLNYLAPFELDGSFYLLSGMRSEPTAPFSFFRIPLDGNMKPDTFMRFRAQLLDSTSWHEMVQRAASRLNTNSTNGDIRQGLEQGLYVVVQHYAHGGDAELEDFITKQFTPDRREGAKRATGELLRRIAMEAMMMAQERAGLPAPDFTVADQERDTLLLNCMIAVSDSFNYGSDFYLQPVSFTEVKSSGFQLTRSPGKPLVYLGSILLVLGIFCMFYIRENRVWVWLGEGRLLLAFSSNRRDDQTDREFASFTAATAQLPGVSEFST